MRSRTLLTLTALVWIPCHARAQPALAYTSNFSAGMITLHDAQSGRALISPSYQTVVNGTGLKPEVRFTVQPSGFDLAITYTNASAKPVPMGNISVPGIRMGRVVSYRDFRAGSNPVEADNRNLDYAGPEAAYPGQSYSPAFVLSDGSAALGMSLLYPVVEYNQPVRMQLISPGGVHAATGRNWEVQFHLAGDLPPGQSRKYTLAVRASTNTEDWARTLVPYRDYFRSKYGAVRYTRDPRPIAAVTISDPFAPPVPGRPDLAGVNRFAQIARERLARGFDRVLFRTPTGLFQVHTELNPPFQFMSRLSEAPAARSSLMALRAISGPGRSIGYCWGNSLLVMDGWDTGASHTLEPTSPRDAARAFAELDVATGLNASVVVLEGFDRLGPADACAWLDRLRQHAPQITFVTSRPGDGVGTADIYHVLTPVVVQNPDAPNALADLLVPGHESWIAPDAAPLDPASQLDRAEQAAAMGFVPVLTCDAAIAGHELNAAPSWRITLPRDLQPTDPDPEPAANPAQDLAKAPQTPAEPALVAPHEPERPPTLRFSAPTFDPGSLNAALDRARISTYSKPRHKPLPTEAKVPEPPKH